jgi:40S ribosomal protein S4 C-terminus/KOW motif
MVTGGRNMGRVGVITHRERHDGGFNIVHIKDAIDNSFATRESNVFVIGQEKPWISLPKGKGVKVSLRILSSIGSVSADSRNSYLSLRNEIAAVLIPLRKVRVALRLSR